MRRGRPRRSRKGQDRKGGQTQAQAHPRFRRTGRARTHPCSGVRSQTGVLHTSRGHAHNPSRPPRNCADHVRARRRTGQAQAPRRAGQAQATAPRRRAGQAQAAGRCQGQLARASQIGAVVHRRAHRSQSQATGRCGVVAHCGSPGRQASCRDRGNEEARGARAAARGTQRDQTQAGPARARAAAEERGGEAAKAQPRARARGA